MTAIYMLFISWKNGLIFYGDYYVLTSAQNYRGNKDF